ncbi:MAG: uroporphyrinogen-III C-methyltransferase [Bacillota bacterium]|nr:uroporphyrinogen-III C-methyltransferase [Bacillota bacterium]
MNKGIVKITGAGIGPADMLTIRAKKALDDCDVIVYDRLLNENIIKPYLGKKEMYYAGKTAGDHYLTQDQINDLILEKAKEGKTVVRLKGGDPYIFGRGGEEALHLLENGVDFEVIPGITSGVLSLMYAGIPATFRDIATSISFITGHRSQGTEANFSQYADLEGTLVFYMGLNNLDQLSSDLIAAGMDKDRPAAVIMHGGYPDQRVQVSTIENIYSDIQGKGFGSPALIVVGDVINLRDQLNFYENLPLFSKKVLVTRARSQASSLREKLENLGAQVIEAPCIEIKEVENPDFIAAIKDFDKRAYSHLVIHSVNGGEIFFKHFLKYRDLRDLAGVKICSIGKMTSKLIRSYGLRPDIEPENFVGEDLLAAIKADSTEEKKIFLAHSNLSRQDLLQGYRDLGQLDAFVVYENTLPEERVDFGEVDYGLFTSSSTVENYLKLYGKESLAGAKVVSIGDITSKTIKDQGLDLYGQSKEATIDSLIEFLKEDVENENEKN